MRQLAVRGAGTRTGGCYTPGRENFLWSRLYMGTAQSQGHRLTSLYVPSGYPGLARFQQVPVRPNPVSPPRPFRADRSLQPDRFAASDYVLFAPLAFAPSCRPGFNGWRPAMQHELDQASTGNRGCSSY